MNTIPHPEQVYRPKPKARTIQRLEDAVAALRLAEEQAAPWQCKLAKDLNTRLT